MIYSFRFPVEAATRRIAALFEAALWRNESRKLERRTDSRARDSGLLPSFCRMFDEDLTAEYSLQDMKPVMGNSCELKMTRISSLVLVKEPRPGRAHTYQIAACPRQYF